MTHSSESEKNIEDFKRLNNLLISLKMLMSVFRVRISSLIEATVSSIAEWFSSNIIFNSKSYDLQIVWKMRHCITF